MIINNKRALAHIQVVHDIRPIEGADNIELVHVLGWTLIAKKGEFHEGDKAVYIEIDSKVPETDERFAFLAHKHFKVKTYKLNKFGVISQGLALPIHEFPELNDAEVNTDVTETLGITYAIVEDNHRKAHVDVWGALRGRRPDLFKKRWFKFLMKYKWGHWIINKIWGKKIVSQTAFPSQYCSKTDEERIQNMPFILEDKEPYVVTEKIDGTSSTYVLVNHAKPGHKPKYEFIVSSRNVRQLDPSQACYHDENVYWEMAFKYDLENKMKEMLEMLPDARYLVLQGETYGANLQGNKYKMTDRDIRFFNISDDHHGKWDTETGAKFTERFGLKWVPIISTNFVLPDTVDEMLTLATGPSTLNDKVLREGWVLRRDTGKGILSFKAVSSEFLLKNKE